MPVIALVSRMSIEQQARVQAVCATAGRPADFLDFSQDREGLPLRGAAAEIVWGRVKPEEFPHLPHLRWIHANWTGIENLIFPALIASQVILTNTRGQSAQAMSEHIVGAVFYLARDFAAFYRSTQNRLWKAEANMSKVQGTRALILGVGAIAGVLLPKLAALSITIRGVNSSGRPAHGVNDMHTLTGVREHLTDIDWLISLMPATAHTRHCIDEPFLRALKPNAGVINLSRGAVLDADALIRCIDDGHIRGAVLDVTDPEPPPADSPLFGHPKVLLTGHQSPRPSDETGVAMDVFLHNLAVYLKGDTASFRNRVDFAKGY